jgi:hypothetical protein
MSIFAIDFTLLAFHITGAFCSPVPALHSRFVPVTALSLMLIFCLLSLRSPLDTLVLHGHVIQFLVHSESYSVSLRILLVCSQHRGIVHLLLYEGTD